MTLQEESFGGEFGGEESGGVEVGGEVRAMSTMMMAFFHYPAFVGVIDERFELGRLGVTMYTCTTTWYMYFIWIKNLREARRRSMLSIVFPGNTWEWNTEMGIHIEKVNAQKKSKKYFLKFF